MLAPAAHTTSHSLESSDGWIVLDLELDEDDISRRLDVVPVRDIVEHDVYRKQAPYCWCHPEVKIVAAEDGGKNTMIYNHGAMDGRE